MSKYPPPPYPTPGEIVFECAVRSGLVRSNEKDSALYDDLKAFKDDRLRPGLDPIKFPKEALTALQGRFSQLVGDEAIAQDVFLCIRKTLSEYSGIVAIYGAGLLERNIMVERVLWPSFYGFAGAAILKSLQGVHPTCSPTQLLEAEAPLGAYLQQLCTQGQSDFDAITTYRAKKDDIDLDNCRDTLKSWLTGDNIPNLDRLHDVLQALNMGDKPGVLVWLPIARLLAKTNKAHRAWLLGWLQPNPEYPNPTELLWELRNHFGNEYGKTLNIGPDRPFSKLRAALYDPTVPRDPAAVEDMLVRMEKNWEPIADKTRSTVDWLRGRYLVLSGHLEEGFKHYEAAYAHGIGRDRETYEYILDEALAVAGALGKKSAIRRFNGLLGLYWKTEWDGDEATLKEHFLRKFPENLRFLG